MDTDIDWTCPLDTLQFQLEEQPQPLSSLELEKIVPAPSPGEPDLPLSIPVYEFSDTERVLPAPSTFEDSPKLSPSFSESPWDPSLSPDSTQSSMRPRGAVEAGELKTKREKNKLSAAKYRNRRKLYLDGLTDKLKTLTEECNAQSKIIAALKIENKMLKDQLAYLKKLVDSFRGIPYTPATARAGIPNVRAGTVGTVVLFVFLAFFLLFAPVHGPSNLSALPLRHSRALLEVNDTEPVFPSVVFDAPYESPLKWTL